jgi:hypothetical protein
MGRGRAKAKQTKVARQLKYSSGGTDLERLQAELAAERGSGSPTQVTSNGDGDGDSDEAEYDGYDSYADDEDEDEDE